MSSFCDTKMVPLAAVIRPLKATELNLFSSFNNDENIESLNVCRLIRAYQLRVLLWGVYICDEPMTMMALCTMRRS